MKIKRKTVAKLPTTSLLVLFSTAKKMINSVWLEESKRCHGPVCNFFFLLVGGLWLGCLIFSFLSFLPKCRAIPQRASEEAQRSCVVRLGAACAPAQALLLFFFCNFLSLSLSLSRPLRVLAEDIEFATTSGQGLECYRSPACLERERERKKKWWRLDRMNCSICLLGA